MVCNLRDMLYLWQKQVFQTSDFPNQVVNVSTTFTFDTAQMAIIEHVLQALQKRDKHYQIRFNIHNSAVDDFDVSLSDHDERQPVFVCNSAFSNLIDRRKFILVTSGPGTGKAQTLLACIERQICMRRNILVVTPTGFVASWYRNKFPVDITTDTVHARFHIPVGPSELPAKNKGIFHILNDNQFGFRKEYSTSLATFQLYDKMSAIDKNKFIIGIFMDWSKAFDTVNHYILFEKLQLYGICSV